MNVLLWHGLVISVEACVGSFASPPFAQQSAQVQNDTIEFILTGNQAYYDSFPFLTATFRASRGKASTLEDALNGQWLPDTEPLVCYYFWAYDGLNEVRRNEYRPEDVAKHRDVWSRTESFLLNGNLGADYHPGQTFHFHIRWAQDTRSRGMIWYQPLNVGKNAPLHEAVRYIRDQPGGSVAYEGEQDLDGKRLHVLLTRQTQSGDKLRRQTDRFWVDPDYGYLPVRIETYMNDETKVAHLTVVKEFRKLSDNRSIPSLYRYVNVTGNNFPGVLLTEIALDELNVDEKPSPDVFQFEVARGVKGINQITQQVYRSRTGRVSLSNFRPDGTLMDEQPDFDIATEFVQVTEAMASPRGGAESNVPTWPFANVESQKGRWLWILIGICSAALATVLVVRYWRH